MDSIALFWSVLTCLLLAIAGGVLRRYDAVEAMVYFAVLACGTLYLLLLVQ